MTRQRLKNWAGRPAHGLEQDAPATIDDEDFAVDVAGRLARQENDLAFEIGGFAPASWLDTGEDLRVSNGLISAAGRYRCGPYR